MVILKVFSEVVIKSCIICRENVENISCVVVVYVDELKLCVIKVVCSSKYRWVVYFYGRVKGIMFEIGLVGYGSCGYFN